VTVTGETLELAIDGASVGSFTSEGIGHPTKRTLRLAIAKRVVVDDLKVFARPDCVVGLSEPFLVRDTQVKHTQREVEKAW